MIYLNYCSMGNNRCLKDLFGEIIRDFSNEDHEMPKETDVIGFDLLGYPFNKKYPADFKSYGSKNGGYSSPFRSTLFYDFAVLRYDLEFSYHGKRYYCLSERDYVALCDCNFREEFKRFDNANVFIETFEVEGRKLIDVIDDLDYAEPI